MTLFEWPSLFRLGRRALPYPPVTHPLLCRQDRIGGIGNQFALTNVLSLIFLLPLMLVMEAGKWGDFVALIKASPSFRFNVIASGMAFYL